MSTRRPDPVSFTFIALGLATAPPPRTHIPTPTTYNPTHTRPAHTHTHSPTPPPRSFHPSRGFNAGPKQGHEAQSLTGPHPAPQHHPTSKSKKTPYLTQKLFQYSTALILGSPAGLGRETTAHSVGHAGGVWGVVDLVVVRGRAGGRISCCADHQQTLL